jgi:O-antigen/teichoic acid export membrane protein
MLKNLRSAAFNSLIYSFGNISTKIIGLILIPVYTKHLTTADYGIMGVLEVTSYAIFVLFGYQLYYALSRWYWDKDYRNKQKEMFFSVMIFLFINCIILLFILLPFSKSFSLLLFDKPDYSYLIKLTIVLSLFQIITNNPGILMRMQEKALIYMVTSTIRLITNLVLTLILIINYHRGVEGIFEAQIVGSFVYLIIIIPYIINNVSIKFDFGLIKLMLVFSFPAIISGISTVIINMADRYFLNFSSGLGSAGLYSFGFKLANTINLIIAASINMAVTPIVYKLIGESNNKRFYSKILTYIVYILVFLSMGLGLFSKEIVKVLAESPSYWEAYNIIPVICLGIIFLNMRDNVMNGLNIEKKTSTIAFILIFTSVSNVLLNYILIKYFDYYGASLAFLITQIMGFFIMYHFAQKHYYIPFENKKLIIMILFYCITSFIGFLINDLNIIMRIIIKSLMLVSFPFILYCFNFYEQIELQRIKELWIKWKNPVKWFINFKNHQD